MYRLVLRAGLEACSPTRCPAQPCLEGISSQTYVCCSLLLSRRMSENHELWIMSCEERKKKYKYSKLKKKKKNKQNLRHTELQVTKGIFSDKWAFKLCHKIRPVPDINPSKAFLAKVSVCGAILTFA